MKSLTTFHIYWKQAKLYKLAENKWEIYLNNKKIIPEAEIILTLKQLWLNPLFGGVGINIFYDHVKFKYIGITKQAVKEFLNSLESYQLHKKLIKVKLSILLCQLLHIIIIS